MPYSANWPSKKEARIQIEALWEQVYGNFSSDRYNWLYVNNTAGAATVCLLRDDDSGTIVGATALLPRTLYSNGNLLRSGIAADLMVDHRHRSLGPAIVLQKAILGRMGDAGIDIVYAFPNPKSIPMTKRIGYRQVAQRVTLSLPLRSEIFLRKTIPYAWLRKPAAMLVDIALYLRPRRFNLLPRFGKEHFLSRDFDHGFDDLWSRVMDRYALIGEKTATFLNWRYRDSPLDDYQVFGLRTRGHARLDGYIVFSRREQRVHIADFACDPAHLDLEELLIRFAYWCRANGADAISIALAASPDLMRSFARAGFLHRDDNEPLTVFSPAGQPIRMEAGQAAGSWYIAPGDNDA